MTPKEEFILAMVLGGILAFPAGWFAGVLYSLISSARYRKAHPGRHGSKGASS